MYGFLKGLRDGDAISPMFYQKFFCGPLAGHYHAVVVKVRVDGEVVCFACRLSHGDTATQLP